MIDEAPEWFFLLRIKTITLMNQYFNIGRKAKTWGKCVRKRLQSRNGLAGE